MKKKNTTIQTAEQAARREQINERLRFAAAAPINDVLWKYNSSFGGLSEVQVEKNRQRYGANKVTRKRKKSLAQRLAGAFINPFTAILLCLAAVSAVTDILMPVMQGMPEEADVLTVVIIMTMVGISGILRFVQESRSGDAAERLLAMITVTCTVDRHDWKRHEIPLEEAVAGDIIRLSAGDMVPADARLIEAKDLFISQSALTGESDLIEKSAEGVPKAGDALTDYGNIVFMGSNVISGSATAVVVAVGDDSLFGSMASAVAEEAVETSFSKGVNSVSWVLIRFMMVMVPVVFFINGFTKGNWVQAFLFAISVAVGLTPEMLPMIVTTCLAKGAVSMSKKKTVVKNLNSIQNFGAIDILCTDKTGTLTQDQVVLEYHMNVMGEEDARVLRHAYLNSYFQSGYKNLMDLAIIRKTEEEEAENPRLTDLSDAYVKVDEVPFDFTRRLSTVVSDKNGKTQMVTKGAVEEMLSICAYVEYDGKIEPLSESLKQKVLKTVDRLNADAACTGYIVQLPLPAGVDTNAILERVDPDKDADGLHPTNLGRLVLRASGPIDSPLPCTPRGCIELMERHGIDLAGRNVCVVGRGVTVGRSIGLLLGRKDVNATVDICHTGTTDLAEHVRRADVVISAAGSPGIITPEMVAPGAVVLDVGVSRVVDPATGKGRIAGDVADGVDEVASWLSPNPGGVGPMTRALLLANVVETAERSL